MKQYLSSLLGLVVLLGLSFSFGSNASAADLLTQDQKLQYYQEYSEIVDDLHNEYPNAPDFSLAEFEHFEERDWVEPEQFREKLLSIINGEFEFKIENPIMTLNASHTPTKHAAAMSNGKKIGNIVINATVATAYDSSTKGQIISSITKISSYTMDGLSHFSQASATPQKVSARSWNVVITGNYTTGGVQFPQHFTINYQTSTTGEIS